MNIDSIKNYPTVSVLKHKQKNKNNALEYNESMGVCDKNLNRGYYSGSFTGKNGAAVKFMDKCLNSVNKLCDDKTVVAQNLVALVMASCFRPVAIMALPGDKKSWKDKAYASAHAIASGLIGFGFSSIIMYPLDKGVKKLKAAAKNFEEGGFDKILTPKRVEKLKKIYQVDDLKVLEKSKIFEKVTKVINMAPDTFVFGIAKACLTIAMIPPILKFFGWEKPSKAPEKSATNSVNKAKLMAKAFFNPEGVAYSNALKINELAQKVEDLEQNKTEGGQK